MHVVLDPDHADEINLTLFDAPRQSAGGEYLSPTEYPFVPKLVEKEKIKARVN